MKIITFKVDKSSVDVTADRKTFDALQYVNWADTKNLTETLQAQTIVNYINLRLINHACTHDEQIYIIENTTDPIPNKADPNAYTYVYGDVSKSVRKKFTEISGTAMEVIHRDQLALNQIGFNVTIYAVVLLDDNDFYYGHIYAWRSPKKQKHNVCFAMGIRSRVDMILLKNQGDGIPNISHYLLEGVFSLAQKIGCDTVVIPTPFPVMIPILHKFGFKSTSEYTDDDTGNSISIKNPCILNRCFHRNITGFIPSLNSTYQYYNIETPKRKPGEIFIL